MSRNQPFLAFSSLALCLAHFEDDEVTVVGLVSLITAFVFFLSKSIDQFDWLGWSIDFDMGIKCSDFGILIFFGFITFLITEAEKLENLLHF
jgi:hypothetical protein